MPLTRTPMKFPMQAGIDTRTSDFEVADPKLAALDNGYLSDPRTVSKRNGYAKLTPALSGVTKTLGLFSRGNDLFTVDNTTVFPYTYSAADGQLDVFETIGSGTTAPSPSALPFCNLSFRKIFDTFPDNGAGTAASSIAHVPGYYLVTSNIPNATTFNPYSFAIYDDTTMAMLTVKPFNHKDVVLGCAVGGQLFLLSKSSANVTVEYIQIAPGNAVTVGTAVSVISDVNTTGSGAVDFFQLPNGTVFCAYQSSTALTTKYGIIDLVAATFTSLGTQATAAEPIAIGVAYESTAGNFAITWSMEAATLRVDSRMYGPNGTALFAAATVSTAFSAAATHFNAVSSTFATPSTLTVFYNFQDPTGFAVVSNTITTAGSVGSTGTLINSCCLISKAWTVPGITVPLVIVSGISTLGQNTYYVYSPFKVIATIFPGNAYTAGASSPTPTCVPMISGTTVSIGLPSFYVTGTGTLRPRMVSVTMDFAAPMMGVSVARSVYFPGGIVRSYDGRRIDEQGWLRFPEGNTIASSNAGGSLLSSTQYAYYVVFEAPSAGGELIQSAAVENLKVTTGVADNTATITIQCTGFTTRSDGYILVYRREQGGLNYHLVASRNPADASLTANGNLSNLLTSRTVTFVDKMAEATMVANELLYLSEDITDNVPPPPCTIATSGNGRVFLSGFDDPDLIWYSKTRGTGEWLNFTDVNTIVVETGIGPIAALGCLSDNLFIFRASQIYVCGGDGLDNTGTTGSFTTPRLISEGIGCSNPRSIVSVNGSLYFQSAKGIYALDASGALSYVGADVEMYNAETVTSAIALTTSNQIRFTTANRTLVYNYELKAWFHWTIGAAGAVLWQGKHVLLPGSTSLTLVETPGTFLDNSLPYTMAIELPWITPVQPGATDQGKCRLYWASFLGTYLAPHQALVKVGYDYEPVFAEQHTWVPAPVLVSGSGAYGGANYGTGVYGGTSALYNASQSYQFTVRVSRQRCQAFKIRIEDQGPQAGGVLGNSFSLSEIGMVLGLRPTVPTVGIERRS